MASQGNNYWSTAVKVSNDRYNYSAMGKRLGDRTAISQIVDGKRYFSSLDAEIYFGDSYIDEITQIQWSIEQSTLPLYGFNSYTFDDIAVGARQINGVFMVNFTKANFMYELLDSLTAVSRSTFYSPNDYGGKLKWNSFFEKEHSASWDRSFNIRVGYGDYNNKGDQTTNLVIQCVQITGCQQVIGIDGSVIGEAYSFIAKDIRSELSIPEAPITTDTEDAIKEELFVFVLSSGKLIQILPDSNEISDIKNYGYKIELNYENSNGVIKNILLKMRKATDGQAINISTLNMGVSPSNGIRYFIPSEYKSTIDKEFIAQGKNGIDTKYLYIDILIEYTDVDDDVVKMHALTDQIITLTTQ